MTRKLLDEAVFLIYYSKNMIQDLVILPTYNERLNIADLIHAIFNAHPHVGVLVVDDNSPDGTASVVQELQGRYPNLRLLLRQKKNGLGAAYIHAFREALKERQLRLLIMMDADFSHDPKYIKTFFHYITQCDVVVGSRYVKGGMTTGWELRRRILSYLGNRYLRFLTGIPIADCTGGFNCVRREMLGQIDLENLLSFRGYAFIIALKYYLWKSGARFKEIPIMFKNRTKGNSKISNSIIQEGLFTPWRLALSKKGWFGKHTLLIVALTAFGFILRLAAIQFGIPYDNVFGDEIAHIITVFHFLENKTIVANFPSAYLPPLMAYFTTPLVVVGGLWGMVSGAFSGIEGFREFAILHREYFLIAPRIVSATLSSFAIPLMYLLGRRLFNERVAVLATLFMAADFLHIHESQVGHIWGPMVAFILLAFYLMLRMYDSGSLRSHLWTACAIAWGYGWGQIPVFLYPWYFIFHVFSRQQRGKAFLRRLTDKNFLLGTGFFLLFFVLFTVLNPITFYKHFNDTLQAFDVFFGTHFGKVFESPFSLASDTASFSFLRNWRVIVTTYANTNPTLFFIGLLGMATIFIRPPNNAFSARIIMFFPIVYLIVFSLLFYRLTLRYVLPATPFFLMAAAYFLAWLMEFRTRLITQVGVIIMLVAIIYSLGIDSRYQFLLRKPYTVSEAMAWVHRNVPSGSRIISSQFLWPNRESMEFLERYNSIGWIDTRRKLLLVLPEERYPKPNYFVIDTNLISLNTLPTEERKADYVFISYYYQFGEEIKQSLLTLYPTAEKIYALYPKGTDQPVKNLMNLDPVFASELFHITQLGPNVEIYKIY